jgi:hypothetical protein
MSDTDWFCDRCGAYKAEETSEYSRYVERVAGEPSHGFYKFEGFKHLCSRCSVIHRANKHYNARLWEKCKKEFAERRKVEVERKEFILEEEYQRALKYLEENQ